ncbi:cytochrome P450 [Saccharopolyspora sp. NPDC050642]|uniref:cytochrome P450 n=1 Tax=Saccharopolyspora sp. NPDC050642 TaxID=3157099 RepID=UPI0033C9EEE8
MTETDSTSTFPEARTCPYQPPSTYREFQQRGPLCRVEQYDGAMAWVVTRYDTARRLLADHRLSADRTHPGFPLLSARFEAVREQQPRLPLVAMDPPEHGVYRRMVLKEFTVKRVRELRPALERIARRFADDLVDAGPPADLVPTFALPVPSMVICEVLGVPFDDHDFFRDVGQRMAESADPEDIAAARGEMVEYLDGLVTARQGEPGPGLISRLVTERLARGELDREDVVAMAEFLLVAGHETTASMISLSVLTLLEHPEQLAILRSDPSAMPSAVEELLRYLSVADLAGVRVAVDDIEVDGRLIRAGDGVIVPNALANRDPHAFADPDTFDIRRAARHHVGFGFGVHQCLGQNLARAELEIALSVLLERLPTLSLAVDDVRELPVRAATTIQGINKLPITW